MWSIPIPDRDEAATHSHMGHFVSQTWPTHIATGTDRINP